MLIIITDDVFYLSSYFINRFRYTKIELPVLLPVYRVAVKPVREGTLFRKFEAIAFQKMFKNAIWLSGDHPIGTGVKMAVFWSFGPTVRRSREFLQYIRHFIYR